MDQQIIDEGERKLDATITSMWALLERQRAAFVDEGPVSAEVRIDRLDRLIALLTENREPLTDAMQADFGHRPKRCPGCSNRSSDGRLAQRVAGESNLWEVTVGEPTMPSPSQQPKSLEVRVRQTLSGDGATTSRATIFCPGQGRSLDLTDCLSCKEFVEMSLDLGGQSGVLKCHPSEGRIPRSLPQGALERGSASSAGGKLATLADSTPISALMSSNVCCVRQDVRVQALASLLIEGGLSGVPVVDERGAPIGIVSQADLVRHHYESGTASHRPPWTVGDIMADVSFILDEGASVSQAAALMALESIDRIPVVDAVGQLVGTLSSLDVLYWLACETGYVVDVVRSFLSKR